MSRRQLVLNSFDLTRLVNEGYSVRIKSGHLLVDDIPFATDGQVIGRGSLVCPLDLQGETTMRPQTHVMWFIGGIPCTKDGAEVPLLLHQRGPQPLAEGIIADCSFSQKMGGRDYENFYEKVVAYVGIILGHAQALDPDVVPTTFRPVETDEDDGVFKYLDTNSSRAGIMSQTDRLAVDRIAIIGLGGTGSYLLDLLAKTPIREIHLYDGDIFSTHNAFRAPAAASVDELNAAPYKVHHHASRYEPFRRGLHPHAEYVTADNMDVLLAMDFVFLSMDASTDKEVIVDRLTRANVPFIDTGIGVARSEDGLAGLVRVTTSLPGHRAHVEENGLISYVLGDEDEYEYETNIQVAELNALAAVLAVIAFKKKLGFYRDEVKELHALYRIDTNEILNSFGEEDEDEDEGGVGLVNAA
ncbi:ThiF family adenylyltransferase [Cryobacterium aureum]|uniref:ThiF family adenylyltransferase n=1 Tax=Cryobacterium aureum TaxID=995037 RepID=UPI000CF4DD31|nr:ThiF family adenylyltransferase [Cryobacterium aureum]